MYSKADLKRNHILETAKQFIVENDISSLTLDAVSKKAGISKGGLLYHFPNKQKLIMGLGEHIFEEFERDFYKLGESDPVQTGKWARALIKTTEADLTQKAELNVGVLAASILDSEASKKMSATYNAILEKLQDDGLDPVVVDIIRLSLDGLYYSQTLNVAPLKTDRIKAVIQELMKMTKCEGSL